MTFTRPTFRHPELAANEAGFSRRDYEGFISTLCAGCGHDSISNAIIHSICDDAPCLAPDSLPASC